MLRFSVAAGAGVRGAYDGVPGRGSKRVPQVNGCAVRAGLSFLRGGDFGEHVVAVDLPIVSLWLGHGVDRKQCKSSVTARETVKSVGVG